VILKKVTVADEVGLVEMLIAAGLLHRSAADDRTAVTDATTKFINAAVREHFLEFKE
jgi:hypothetical protein